MLVAAVLGAAGGYAAWRFAFSEPTVDDRGFVTLMPAKPPAPPKELLGTSAPGFKLPAIRGGERGLDEWRGKVVLLNFWATWCAPCREEMPMLVDLRAALVVQGFEIVGLGVDDRDAIVEFRSEFGVTFPLVYGDMAVLKLSQQYGNRIGALPYSVLIDRAGKIRLMKAGILEKSAITESIKALL